MLWINRFWTEEEGAEVAEWVLFVAVLAVVVMAAAAALKPALSSAYTALGNSIEAHSTFGEEEVGG